MKTAAAFIVAALALGSCASRDDIETYTQETCAPLKTSGTPADYDKCVIQTRQFCASRNATHSNFSDCRPHK
jgi:hypothetical protein